MNGIFEQGLTPNLPEPTPEPDEWMRRLGALPLMHHPGERWQYHISNDLLGVLVARVTGQTFETFLRERIFEPLGMKETSFHVSADKIDRLPPLYAPDPQTWGVSCVGRGQGGRHSQPPAFHGGGGGLCSTADDYHAYFQMLLNHGMHGAKRILSRSAVQLMTTNRHTPEQQAARSVMARDNVHVSFGQGQHGGWGSAWRYASTGVTTRPSVSSVGTAEHSTYADPNNQLTGILLTQVGLSAPDSARLIHDFWTTIYQANED
ncbi:serine hydrolase domain-containing protein [Paenibacillus xylanilyticus]|uniref:serine hydrolase domain-containing protein n=1 Tax=Paenibacillus xylanilyticus TaxID=248903 RepID=UPI0039A1AC69